MKIHRSTKASFKFATSKKMEALKGITEEYTRLVNAFIDKMWDWNRIPSKMELLASLINTVPTNASFRLAKEAAREAVTMISQAKNRKTSRGKNNKVVREVVKPHHYGKRMMLGVTMANIEMANKSEHFDAWLSVGAISTICGYSKLRIPIKFHKHYHKLQNLGKLVSSVFIHKNYVQITFEIETGEKFNIKTALGVDTGINTLGMADDGSRFGSDIKDNLKRMDKCVQGSNGYTRARWALKQKIDKEAKRVVEYALKSGAGMVVVENLNGITTKKKFQPGRRQGLKMRRWIGRWNVQYWLKRLQAACEMNRVRFSSVSPYKTSQTCPSCTHADSKNRNGEVFECLKCGFKAHADVVGARNIVARFISGPYGAGFKTLEHSVTVNLT